MHVTNKNFSNRDLLEINRHLFQGLLKLQPGRQRFKAPETVFCWIAKWRKHKGKNCKAAVSYISCLSRITIAADEKGECLLSKDWLGPEMVNNYKVGP